MTRFLYIFIVLQILPILRFDGQNFPCSTNNFIFTKEENLITMLHFFSLYDPKQSKYLKNFDSILKSGGSKHCTVKSHQLQKYYNHPL